MNSLSFCGEKIQFCQQKCVYFEVLILRAEIFSGTEVVKRKQMSNKKNPRTDMAKQEHIQLLK